MATPGGPTVVTPALLSAAEVAAHLGTCRATVYNLIDRGMPSLKVGRCRRFRLDDVLAWLEAQQNGPEAA